ncbi:hypothetical protein QR680_003370 [Steinernema hermaphroditum]|uniref:Oligopeptide transporter 1 n=1 Tax=Steinernema hermaphroditum TaxID=289476 RepID=A0AA39LK71_9BILA|nr:hypothetical protein QR680_003370 [Steinernema hermaphroditum]
MTAKRHDANGVAVTRNDGFDEYSLEKFEKGRADHNDPEPQTWGEIAKRWPKVTFCIVGNEFCERFSFYGMRTILALYLVNILKQTTDQATISTHAFISLAYFTPILGSILADGYIGKFWTILSISILYAAGNVVLAVSASFDAGASVHPYLDIAGLVMIAFGTGGIKPCVSSFGADQFPANYTKMISIFFSVFYFSINAGSTISMAITPRIRVMPCMGHDSCYPLAFGIPAAIMVVSTVIFVLGSYYYKKVPPKENVIAKVAKAISKAIYNMITKSVKREHWMDHYLDGHNCENDEQCLALAVKGKRIGEKCAQQKFADDCKSLVRVAVMMVPMIIFWACYDQQSTRWIFQACEMNSEIWPGFTMPPEQMGLFNAVLILCFIPIFQGIVYPLVEKCGIKTTPLRRMTAGGILASATFVVSGFVQIAVNQTLPDIPADNTAFISVINVFPNCNVNVTADNINKYIIANSSLLDDKVLKYHELFRLDVGSKKDVQFKFDYSGAECYGYSSISHSFSLEGGKTYYIATTPQGIVGDSSVLDKPQEGEGQSSVSVNLLLSCGNLPPGVNWDDGCKSSTTPYETSYTSMIAACEFDAEDPHCDGRNRLFFTWKAGDATAIRELASGNATRSATIYGHEDIMPGMYQMFYVKYKHYMGDRSPARSDLIAYPITDVYLNITGQGGVYTYTMAKNGDLHNTAAKNIFYLHTVVPRNHISILWQIPQYVLITAAEILFSITGLEFSYSQAAPSLKSVVTAMFLLTTALGDTLIILLDVIIDLRNLAIIFFIYAGMMLGIMLVFVVLSVFYYDYVDYSTIDDDEEDNVQGRDNFSIIQRKEADVFYVFGVDMNGNRIGMKKDSSDDKGVLSNFQNGAIPSHRSEDLDSEPTGFKERVKQWPKATFCIIGNEFCERFSYYGMRSVLTLYLINILQFSNDNATILYHAFTVVAFTSPMIGSIIADGYIGKFWTIFSLSLIYACGNVVLAVASTFDKANHLHPWLDLAGLFIIGLGTGGIKPCVSAFGADQFPAHYVVMISIFFSVFYFTINAGSTISMFITPFFRTIPCMGHDSCYPLAFGIPAVLMVISTVVFVLGSFFYKKVPPKENIIARVFKAICKAIYNKITRRHIRREHWLDHYLDGHLCEHDSKCLALAVKGKRLGEKCAQQKFADDCKSLGSRWLIQAVEMDSEIWNGYNLLPDQMGVLNAILILAFIPIFQAFVYPLVEKCGIRTTPLRRMVAGGLLAALSFAVCGFVQLKVNQTLPDIPADNMGFVSVINVFEKCNVSVSARGKDHAVFANQSLVDDKVNDIQQLFRFKVSTKDEIKFEFTYSGTGCFGYDKAPLNAGVNISGGNTYFIATTPQGVFTGTSNLAKPQEGEGESSVSLNLLLPCTFLPPNVTWDSGCSASRTPELNSYSGRIAACEFSENPYCDPRNRKYYVWKENEAARSSIRAKDGTLSNGTAYNHKDIKAGLYQLFYVRYLKPDGDRTPSKDDLEVYPIPGVVLSILGQGGVYTLTIAKNGTLKSSSDTSVFNVHTVVPRNHVSILWQVPQYVIITAAEILFSITGLEFSYSQAAPSLKSVVTAIWWFTVAFGDLIIIIIDKIVKIENLAIIMFVFAAAMVIVIGIFVLLSIFYYEYVDYSQQGQDEDNDLNENDALSYMNSDEDFPTKF